MTQDNNITHGKKTSDVEASSEETSNVVVISAQETEDTSKDQQEAAGGNSDNDDKKPKKKRKTTSRACDACAIRKVKCEATRPCSHCVSNGLKCTQLRARKKSGPKNLHKKTLESINSFAVNVDKNTNVFDVRYVNGSVLPNTIKAEVPKYSVENVPDSLHSSLPDSPNAPVLLTVRNIMKLLKLLDDSFLFKCMEKLTVNSLLHNRAKLSEFLSKEYPDENSTLTFKNKDITLVSKFLLILTLCLLIAENVLKMQNVRYQLNLQGLSYEEIKSFKGMLPDIIAEALFPIEMLSISPLNVSNNNASTYQLVYYNQSVSSIHLLNFHEITNYLHRQNQDQQKLIHLRRAITYYQLIIPPFKNTPELSDIQVYELFETLFTSESLYFFLSSDFIIKSNNVLLNDWYSFNIAQVQNKPGNNSLFEIFRTINKEELINTKAINFLFKFSPFNFNRSSSIKIVKGFDMDPNIGNASYDEFKCFLDGLVNDDNMFKLLRLIILFKIIIIHCNELNFVLLKLEFMEVMKNLNEVLNEKEELLKLQISNYQLLPHLLQVLRLNLEIDDRNSTEYRSDFDNFTYHLVSLFPICSRTANKIIKSNDILNDWFNNWNAPQRNVIPHSESNIESYDIIEQILQDFCKDQVLMPEFVLNSTFVNPSPLQEHTPASRESVSYVGDDATKNKDPPSVLHGSNSRDLLSEFACLPVSNSYKNLFNFGTSSEVPAGSSTSLSNLFQYGATPKVDIPLMNDDFRISHSSFSL